MARVVWCLALLWHARASEMSKCQERTSVPLLWPFTGLLTMLLGIGFIYAIGRLTSQFLFWAFELRSEEDVEHYLSDQPMLSLLVTSLQLIVLAVAVVGSIAVALASAPTIGGFPWLQQDLVFPKHALECAFEVLLPRRLPSLIHVLHCPMIVLAASLGFGGSLLWLSSEEIPFLQGRRWLARLLAAAFLGGAVFMGVLIAGFTSQRLPWLDVQAVPEEPVSCMLHMVEAPILFPEHAGVYISGPRYKHRQEYFVSLLLWLTIVACFAGQLLTFMGRTWRRAIGAEYTLLTPERVQISVVEHVFLHLLCAGVACFFVVTDRLDIYKGVAWEAYVIWVLTMLISSILQATYYMLTLPMESEIPCFGKAIIEGILPVLGEPLDSFKDWIFIGIAVSTKNPLGYVFAVLGCCILALSNMHLRKHYPEELARALLPVRSLCLPGEERSILAKQTSPAKLAIALTEDLPQALLQSAFVMVFGGSATQYAFIGVSVAKIIACVALRAVILECEDRHGEAWASSIEYYQLQISMFSCIFGRKHPWVLDARMDLAMNFYELGRNTEALELRQAVLETRREVLGTKDPNTLEAEYTVALTLARLGRGEESLQIFTEHFKANREVLGPRHHDTLEAQLGMAFALELLGRPAEAAEQEQEVFEVRREDLGPRDPSTLLAQHNFAESLRQAGQLQEALEQLKEVLRLRREVLGPKHPKTLKSERAVAQTLRKQGRSREALQAFEELLALEREVLGPEHPRTLTAQELYKQLLQEVEASNP